MRKNLKEAYATSYLFKICIEYKIPHEARRKLNLMIKKYESKQYNEGYRLGVKDGELNIKKRIKKLVKDVLSSVW